MQGILWPAPSIDAQDIAAAGNSVWQIRRRDPDQVFVLNRRGWGAVYARPQYLGYRLAFDLVMPHDSAGRDVDHLLPKSRAAGQGFIALGRIGIVSNRGWNDDESNQAMAQKVRDMGTGNPHQFTSFLTDLERGWAVVTSFIRPFTELNTKQLTKVEHSGRSAKTA